MNKATILIPAFLFSTSQFQQAKKVEDVERKSEMPNIILILADDLGYGDVGFHGSDIRTPNLDRLAQEGVELDQFYVCPMSSPTRAGLLTGRYPIRFGLMRSVIPPYREFGLPPEEFTVAEMLGEAGYKHRGIAGKWHLGHRQRKWLPTNQGFTFFEGCHNGAVDYFTRDRDGETDWHQNETPLSREGYTTDLIGNAAINFIREVPKNEPFFLYVSFTAPHAPYQAKPEDIAKYPNREGQKKIYAAMIDCMDQNIGRIINCVEKRGQLEDTFILFCSDNGGVKNVADNRPLRGSKLTVYQGGINVVAVAYWQGGGISGGRKVSQRMGYIDIFPTLMGIANYKRNLINEIDGLDVLKAMQGKEKPSDRKWFSYLDQDDKKIEHLAVNTNQWKLIWRRNAPDNKINSEKVELFGIDEDPSETTNLAEREPEVVSSLKREIDKFYRLKAIDQIPRYSEKSVLSGPVIPNWQPFH